MGANRTDCPEIADPDLPIPQLFYTMQCWGSGLEISVLLLSYISRPDPTSDCVDLTLAPFACYHRASDRQSVSESFSPYFLVILQHVTLVPLNGRRRANHHLLHGRRFSERHVTFTLNTPY